MVCTTWIHLHRRLSLMIFAGAPSTAPWPITISISRSFGGKQSKTFSLNPSCSGALTILILFETASFLSSSLHSRRKTVNSTNGCLANCVASTLFKVDIPPFLDHHSDDKSKTFTFLGGELSSCSLASWKVDSMSAPQMYVNLTRQKSWTLSADLGNGRIMNLWEKSWRN